MQGQARRTLRTRRKKKPWELTEKDIYKHPDWIDNPVLLGWALSRPLDEKLEWGPDPLYAYRGAGRKEEIQSVFRGGESGGFWYNYPNATFAGAGLFIARNPYPEYPRMGEIPWNFRRSFRKMRAIYIRPRAFGSRFGPLIRVSPIMTPEEWSRYYPRGERMYWALYGKPEVIDLLEQAPIRKYQNWAGELREEHKRINKS